jgi:hypothetical protein
MCLTLCLVHHYRGEAYSSQDRTIQQGQVALWPQIDIVGLSGRNNIAFRELSVNSLNDGASRDNQSEGDLEDTTNHTL